MLRTFFPRLRSSREREPVPDAPYAGQLKDVPSELVFIMGCHRSGTSFLYHLLAHAGQVDYISAYDIIKYKELLYNRITGQESRVKADLERLLKQEPTRGLDELPVGIDLPEEYRFLMRHESRPIMLNLAEILERLFFSPHLTPATVDGFLEICGKKRFLARQDRPLILKNPSDYYFNFWAVHQMFPHAKFIFIHRHPLTMLNSYLHSFPSMLLRRSNYAALIDPGYGGLFGRLGLRRHLFLRIFRSDRLCRLLVSRVAESFQYYMAHVGRLPKSQYVSIRYEDLCGDPGGCLSHIAEHLQLAIEPRLPQALGAPRQLPVLDSIKRHYAAHLAEMAPYMRHLHYAAWPKADPTASDTPVPANKAVAKDSEHEPCVGAAPA